MMVATLDRYLRTVCVEALVQDDEIFDPLAILFASVLAALRQDESEDDIDLDETTSSDDG